MQETPGSTLTLVDRRNRDQRGVALLEALVASAVLSIVAVAVTASIVTAMRASAFHRELANAEVVARNYSDALAATPYIPCATASDYAAPVGFSSVPGYRIEVGQSDPSEPAVEFWVKGSNPASFASTCDSADSTSDSGLQRVWYQVIRDRASGPKVVRSTNALKRYTGTNDNSFGEVPGGGKRCTITASEDASLSEANPTQVDGTALTMTVTGNSGGRFRSLVKFPIVPGHTPCAEGGELPTGMQVRSASLRLFTWKVEGAVDCATDCTHVLKRVTTAWSEDSATWGTPLATLADGNEVFDHGSGSGDFGPRFQVVTRPGLALDVATYYAVPSLNQGWAIDQACPPDYPGRNCNADGAAFRMRTSEWGIAAPGSGAVPGEAVADRQVSCTATRSSADRMRVRARFVDKGGNNPRAEVEIIDRVFND
ncbi:MAG: type II secretion system protein [Microthrixaceae bacterium]|nr:type II secretion system protein [Microthrixaceae bacterium]